MTYNAVYQQNLCDIRLCNNERDNVASTSVLRGPSRVPDTIDACRRHRDDLDYGATLDIYYDYRPVPVSKK